MNTNTQNKSRSKLKISTRVELPGECCKKCKFFMSESDEQGLCRRNPPLPIFTGQGIIAFFPSLLNGGWCGEFVRNGGD